MIEILGYRALARGLDRIATRIHQHGQEQCAESAKLDRRDHGVAILPLVAVSNEISWRRAWDHFAMIAFIGPTTKN